MKLVILLIFMFLLSCNESQIVRITGTRQASDIIINKAQEVIVEVIYEQGAAPIVGLNSSGFDSWDIFKDNLNEIYKDKAAQDRVFVPKTLDEMKEIPDQQTSIWSVSALTSLAFEYQDRQQAVDRVVFVVLFVNGRLESSERNGIGTIGLSIGNTRVITVFKDITNSLSVTDDVKSFMEQSTLVHEMGHAIGLVNRGIPLTTEHQDEEHGSHCTNPECTMFWLNEGVSDLEEFVDRYITSGSTILFGPECLRDIREFSI